MNFNKICQKEQFILLEHLHELSVRYGLRSLSLLVKVKFFFCRKSSCCVFQEELPHNFMIFLEDNINKLEISRLKKIKFNNFYSIRLFIKLLLPVTILKKLGLPSSETLHKLDFLHLFLDQYLLPLFFEYFNFSLLLLSFVLIHNWWMKFFKVFKNRVWGCHSYIDSWAIWSFLVCVASWLWSSALPNFFKMLFLHIPRIAK